MKQFLAVYTGNSGARNVEISPEARQREIVAWREWMRHNADRLVTPGGPLGRTKRVTGDGIADIRNAMAAFVIVKAGSHDEAAALFEGHPHFTIFPGDGVEIMECLPSPGS